MIYWALWVVLMGMVRSRLGKATVFVGQCIKAY